MNLLKPFGLHGSTSPNSMEMHGNSSAPPSPSPPPTGGSRPPSQGQRRSPPPHRNEPLPLLHLPHGTPLLMGGENSAFNPIHHFQNHYHHQATLRLNSISKNNSLHLPGTKTKREEEDDHPMSSRSASPHSDSSELVDMSESEGEEPEIKSPEHLPHRVRTHQVSKFAKQIQPRCQSPSKRE